jgi:hypothetical protein
MVFIPVPNLVSSSPVNSMHQNYRQQWTNYNGMQQHDVKWKKPCTKESVIPDSLYITSKVSRVLEITRVVTWRYIVVDRGELWPKYSSISWSGYGIHGKFLHCANLFMILYIYISYTSTKILIQQSFLCETCFSVVFKIVTEIEVWLMWAISLTDILFPLRIVAQDRKEKLKGKKKFSLDRA